MVTSKKQHNIALIMLCATATVWGLGFLLSKLLLEVGFGDIPLTANAIRFCVAATVLSLVFCRAVKLTKKLLLYGSLGGLFLFGGFTLQLFGLKYTTPSSNGFFTAAYALFVPLLSWIVSKRRPTITMFIGAVMAICGLVILNIPNGAQEEASNELLGNMLTLAGSLFFAMQIVLTDKALHDEKLPSLNLTVVQLCACAILFAISALIFESEKYSSVQIDWTQSLWLFAIISLLGTAFAYFAQTYGQSHLSPTEVSVIVACESPIGAIFSVAFGYENFSVQLLVGGILIFLSVLIMEILPRLKKK